MLTSGLNPDVVKSGLDKLFYKEWDAPQLPQIADANDKDVFFQMGSSQASETIEEFKGSGEWEERAELADPSEGQPMAKYSQTLSNKTLSKGITIAKRLFDDDQNGMVSKMVMDFSRKGRASRDKDAMSLYRGAFTTTGGDSQYLIDTDHPTDAGTMSNKVSGALSESTLNDALVALMEQQGRDGVVMGDLASVLFVPAKLFKTAVEITESKVKVGANNATMNFYSDKFGIVVKTSPYLGATAGGSDTAWFLLSKNHSMLRYEREAINTNMIDWKQNKNRSYYYNGELRQTVGQADPFGIVGSLGT